MSDAVTLREVDNTAVRRISSSGCVPFAPRRDEASVQASLKALTESARQGNGNLLALAITAMRARATVGEVSDALETVWGRYRAETRSVSGVYSAAYADDPQWQQLRADIKAFADSHGRRPRLMMAKLGQDGHDRGVKVVATAFADAGFDVDIGPLFQTPQECARQAIENDVHAIGISTLAAGHKTLVPEIIAALRAQGAPDIVVFVGGIVPEQDHAFLREIGRQRHLRTGHASHAVRARCAAADPPALTMIDGMQVR